MFGDLPGAKEMATIRVRFAGAMRGVSVLAIPGPDPRITHLALEHDLFSPQGKGKIYCNDGATRPFATDASKFALFSAAVANYIDNLEELPDIVHLHDWHTGMYCALRAYESHYRNLKSVRTVYTIHNLAMQGIRPLDGDESSLATWFPDLDYDPDVIVDPRYPDCVNPMRTAIRLADKVNTVSQTYAREILRPNDPAHGFFGGEGLESDLRVLADDGRLTGILNGCVYEKRNRRRPGWRGLLSVIEKEIQSWNSEAGPGAWINDLALERLKLLPKRRPANVLTCIGRLTAQKMGLFLSKSEPRESALEEMLNDLGSNGVLILLGNGDPELEQQIATLARDRKNFLFLCGYSETFAEMLYAIGDLFLMPSTFEPCGISQMLAMRAGQPCVVHAVGGLKDTINHDVDGFSFDGDSTESQARNFVDTVREALVIKAEAPERWLKIRDRAAAARFTWAGSAELYTGVLYD